MALFRCPVIYCSFNNYIIVAKLDSAIKSNDPKILQMELQGSIGTTVNQVTTQLHIDVYD